MKPTTSICLFILFVNTAYFGVYQIMIFRAKWNASTLIRNSNYPERIQILKLTSKEAESFDEDEITYHGKLFDVAKRIALPDSLEIPVRRK